MNRCRSVLLYLIMSVSFYEFRIENFLNSFGVSKWVYSCCLVTGISCSLRYGIIRLKCCSGCSLTVRSVIIGIAGSGFLIWLPLAFNFLISRLLLFLFSSDFRLPCFILPEFIIRVVEAPSLVTLCSRELAWSNTKREPLTSH